MHNVIENVTSLTKSEVFHNNFSANFRCKNDFSAKVFNKYGSIIARLDPGEKAIKPHSNGSCILKGIIKKIETEVTYLNRKF